MSRKLEKMIKRRERMPKPKDDGMTCRQRAFLRKYGRTNWYGKDNKL